MKSRRRILDPLRRLYSAYPEPDYREAKVRRRRGPEVAHLFRHWHPPGTEAIRG